jgi:hypothetical protein
MPAVPTGLQAPAEQKLPLWQSLEVVHGFLHAPVEQMYGAQSVPDDDEQVPLPSQIWPFTVFPWQLVEPQAVPVG